MKEIKGVEVFSAGVWNGDKYTIDDIDEMIMAFNETSEQVKPHLKLGHNDEQTLLAAEGLPAAGWVGKLYRQGEKLIADFVDIPDKIYQLLSNKAYRKVSSEIYWNITFNGKKYKRMMSAIALLGANMPAVQNLNDILALYGLKDYDTIKNYSDDFETKKYDINHGEDNMELEKELNEVKENFAAKEVELKEYKEQVDADKIESEKEVAELKEYKENAEKEKVELLAKQLETENQAFIDGLEISPAMQPLVFALIDDKKEYKKDEKVFTNKEIIKELFSLKGASDVNLDEDSEEGDKKVVDSVDAKLVEINKYADENKVEFNEAYRIVMSK